MSAYDYSRPLAAANRMIERYGQLGAVERPGTVTGGTPGNPTTGDPTPEPARFVITSFDSRDIDGTRIKAKDKKALVAPGALTADPTTDDRLLEADGTAWEIVDVETLRPAETALLYTVQIRR